MQSALKLKNASFVKIIALILLNSEGTYDLTDVRAKINDEESRLDVLILSKYPTIAKSRAISPQRTKCLNLPHRELTGKTLYNLIYLTGLSTA